MENESRNWNLDMRDTNQSMRGDCRYQPIRMQNPFTKGPDTEKIVINAAGGQYAGPWVIVWYFH